MLTCLLEVVADGVVVVVVVVVGDGCCRGSSSKRLGSVACKVC